MDEEHITRHIKDSWTTADLPQTGL